MTVFENNSICTSGKAKDEGFQYEGYGGQRLGWPFNSQHLAQQRK